MRLTLELKLSEKGPTKLDRRKPSDSLLTKKTDHGFERLGLESNERGPD